MENQKIEVTQSVDQKNTFIVVMEVSQLSQAIDCDLLSIEEADQLVIEDTTISDEEDVQTGKTEVRDLWSKENLSIAYFNDKKFYACTWLDCDKFLASVEQLKNHIRATHYGEKPFSCHCCGKAFFRKHSLTIHERSHTGVRPYKCEFSRCESTFSTSSDRLRHHRCLRHHGVRSYACVHPGCDKSFTTLSIRAQHMCTHGERRHHCDSCGKEFTSSTNLKNHMRIHDGQRPYVCGVCSKVFTEYSTLYKHRRCHKEKVVDSGVSAIYES